MSDDFGVEMNPSGDDYHNDNENLRDGGAPPLEDPPIFLSVVDDGPLISFCAYNEGSDTIFIETVRANGFEVSTVVPSVLASIKPTLLLLPTRIVSNAPLLQVLTTTPADAAQHEANNISNNNGSDAAPATTPYKILKSSWLDLTKCRQVVMTLQVKSLMQRQQQHEYSHPPPQPSQNSSTTQSFGVSHYNALASLVNFDCKVLMQAMGSLLVFLQSSVLLPPPPQEPNYNNSYYSSNQDSHDDNITVSHLQLLHVDQYVYIPPSTIEALHIFRTDHHPLALAGGGTSHKSKEGYSLFSWLDRTHFADARVRLKEWMHQPLRNVASIKLRQDGVELFCQHDFVSVAVSLAEQAKHLKPSVSSILSRMTKNTSTPLDFVRLVQTLTCASSMLDCLQNQVLWKLQQWEQRVQWERQQQQQMGRNGEHDAGDGDETDRSDSDIDFPPVHDYIAFIESILERCYTQLLKKILNQIVETVNLELTAETLAFTSCDGVDPELDRYRADYQIIKQLLDSCAARIQARFPSYPLLKVIFFPQLGYFVSIKQGADGEASTSTYHDIYSELDNSEHLRLVWIFRDGGNNYYRTQETHDMDANVGDLDIAIRNAEFMISSQLEDDILECDAELKATYSSLSNLDCILSFAEMARHQRLVRPDVVPAEENCILIARGGHPLQEQSSPDRFVRNHTVIDEESRVNVVTGPNYSGKSCYARQVGILVYMAHLGCFLPCEMAKISVVDRILAQFSGVETCSVPQSSFQLDLTNMGGIIRTATQHSLVIVDEFGKGTSPASGIALLAAALQTLSEIGCKVVCTTHFLEIFSVNLLAHGTDGVRACQMTVEFPDDDEELPIPSFVLAEGLSTTSAGLACARLSGVKASVIARAREIVNAMREGRTIRPLDEILLRGLDLTDSDRTTLYNFITADLANGTAESIEQLRAAILRM